MNEYTVFNHYNLQQNKTPLHVAKNKQVAEILILNGADVNSRDMNVSMFNIGDKQSTCCIVTVDGVSSSLR